MIQARPDVETAAIEPSARIVPEVRTALLSTRRLAALFPEPILGPQGRPTSTRLERGLARLRHARRLGWARLQFRLRWIETVRQALVRVRLQLRLRLLRLRHRRTLGR